MKAIYTILLLSFLTLSLFAQRKISRGEDLINKYKYGYEHYIDFEINSRLGSTSISTPYLTRFVFRRDITSMKDTQTQYGGVLLGIVYKKRSKITVGPGHIQSLSKRYRIASVSDSSDIQVIAYGITPEDKEFFRYHIILNDETALTQWATPTVFEQKFDAEHPYAVLWNGKSLGNQIYIEAHDTRNYDTREGVMLNWNLKTKELPKIEGIDGSAGTFEKGNRVLRQYYFSKDSVGSPYFSGFNTIYNFPENLHYRYGEFANIVFRFNIDPGTYYNAEVTKITNDSTREYRHFDQQRFQSWFEVNEYMLSTPGKYEIKIYNTKGDEDDEGNKKEYITIPIEVFSPPEKGKAFTIRQIVPYAAAAILLAAFVFYLYYRRSRRKIAGIEMEKQMSKLRLQSVRNQLDPHFVYNALAGIQNLLNKKDNKSANDYLTRFSRLSRKVLEDAEKDLITIEDEVGLLNDYLQMEQMRFGFAYSIYVDETIDQTNTEIPAMLLQPFVENAVKHAMPEVDGGCIGIRFERTDKSVLVRIRDNGKGFNVAAASGTGSWLSKNRISLLNKVYVDTPVLLDLRSGESGTTVLLTLKEWLA
ncbi:histidine kinase [Niabella sp. CC-SYL272]|uniref:sensor histidine kinase n=1 Tax=Niabella agricola TaxID=2891571 RepID=UPI001F32B152|nr:histidine kinase [Niabella agricola]MCF3110347.1 histidine kinase [Niabella agricola]